MKNSSRPAAAASGRALLETEATSESGLKRKAGVHAEEMKLVGARPRSGTAEQRKRRVTHRRRQLLVGQDHTLAERIGKLRADTTSLLRHCLKLPLQAKYVSALERFLAH